MTLFVHSFIVAFQWRQSEPILNLDDYREFPGSRVQIWAREAEQWEPEGERDEDQLHPEGGGGVQYKFKVVPRSELGLRLNILQ